MTDHPSVVPARRPGAGRIVGFVVLLAAIAWGLGALAAWPWRASALAGRHVVTVALADVGTVSHTWTASRALDIADGAAPLLEYQAGRGWLP